MRGGAISNWEERWAGLAYWLEQMLESRLPRTILCFLTIALLLAYSYFGSKMAAPPLISQPYGVRGYFASGKSVILEEPRLIEQINRRLGELNQLRSQMPFSPKPIDLELTADDARPGFLASRALRLWLDEYLSIDSRGAPMDSTTFGERPGSAVEEEAVIRAIVDLVILDRRSEVGHSRASSWFESARSFSRYCETEPVLPAGWSGLCRHFVGKAKSLSGSPTPMSLVGWLAHELRLEAEGRPLAERALMPAIWFSALKAEAVRGWPQWPLRKNDYGIRLSESLQRLAPGRASVFDPEASLRVAKISRMSELSDDIGDDVRVETVLLSSCSSPRWSDFSKVRARHVLWIRSCGGSESLEEEDAFHSDRPWSERLDRFASVNSERSFIEFGVSEIRLALLKGWITPSDFVDVAVQFDGMRSAARPTDRQWLRSMGAYRFKAPVEVVKLVRLSPARTL